MQYEKVTEMVSNTTSQPIFNKPLLVNFWCNIKDLSEKAIKIFLPETNILLCVKYT